MPYTKVNGITVNYQIEGSGMPFVMISGAGMDLNRWKSQAQFFRNYYMVIRLDNRGVGRSDKPAGPYSTRTMADDTIKLLDFLNVEKAIVMGVSMGGMIAQEIAINYPQRIAKLILVSTLSFVSDQAGFTDEIAAMKGLPPAKARQVLIHYAVNNPLLRLLSTVRVASRSRRGWEAGFEEQTQACMNHNTLERLSLISAATLVVVGTRDRVIRPGCSDILACKIPKARLVKMENGSHSIITEMRKSFNKEVLDFLRCQ